MTEWSRAQQLRRLIGLGLWNSSPNVEDLSPEKRSRDCRMRIRGFMKKRMREKDKLRKLKRGGWHGSWRTLKGTTVTNRLTMRNF